MSSWREIKTSHAADNTTNPIRAIVDTIKPDPQHPLQPFLSLSIGDPCTDGNLLPPKNYIETLQKHAADGSKWNGYGPSTGIPPARQAVAEYFHTNFTKDGVRKDMPFTADDVVLTSGVSHALDISISALCNPGDVLLVPAPCFSLYGTMCDNKGITIEFYQCDADRSWAPNKESMQTAVKKHGDKLKAILSCNPSNPCGSNFTQQSVLDVIAVAEEAQLPIISDETYAGMAYHVDDGSGEAPAEDPQFYSVADLSPSVPALICNGLAKNYVIPGHRMGWILYHDPKQRMPAVWKGVAALTTLLVGPNILVQSALHSILLETPASYTKELKATLAHHASVCYKLVLKAEGLHPIRPQGAMYLMIRIDFDRFTEESGITSDVEFCSKLVKSKNIQCLPGTIFKAPGFVRIVYTKPVDQLEEAVRRIVDFTNENTKKA